MVGCRARDALDGLSVEFISSSEQKVRRAVDVRVSPGRRIRNALPGVPASIAIAQFSLSPNDF
jgi:hypothetical protein